MEWQTNMWATLLSHYPLSPLGTWDYSGLPHKQTKFFWFCKVTQSNKYLTYLTFFVGIHWIRFLHVQCTNLENKVETSKVDADNVKLSACWELTLELRNSSLIFVIRSKNGYGRSGRIRSAFENTARPTSFLFFSTKPFILFSWLDWKIGSAMFTSSNSWGLWRAL